MKNVPFIIAFVTGIGIAANPFLLTDEHVSTKVMVNPNSGKSAKKKNTVWVSFRVKAAMDNKKNKMAEKKLAYAQKIAGELFKAVEKNNLIVAGKSEEQLNMEI